VIQSALYYPHTRVREKEFLKTSLLLWDQLVYISPDGYTPQYPDKQMSQVMELLGKRLIPGQETKSAAHAAILELVKSGIPPWLIDRFRSESEDYYIFRDKLLPDTWNELQRMDLLRGGSFDEYAMNHSLGFMIMGILAKCCAGSQFRMVTDQVVPYVALNKAVVRLTGGEYATQSPSNLREAEPRPDDPRQSLVNITLKVVNTASIELERLVTFRKDEQKEAGYSLTNLRHKYLEAIEESAEEMATKATTSDDRDEILRKFEQKTRNELREMKHRLLGAAADAFLTREMMTAVAAPLASTVASIVFPPSAPVVTFLGGLTGIGLLGRQSIKYGQKREEVLADYPIVSYLYSMKPLTVL